jgi:hypothetical protein
MLLDERSQLGRCRRVLDQIIANELHPCIEVRTPPFTQPLGVAINEGELSLIIPGGDQLVGRPLHARGQSVAELFSGEIRLQPQPDGGLIALWNLQPTALLKGVGTGLSGSPIRHFTSPQ